MSEANTRFYEIESERDELRTQVGILQAKNHLLQHELDTAKSANGMAVVYALEHASERFKSPDVAWVRQYLSQCAVDKLKEIKSC